MEIIQLLKKSHSLFLILFVVSVSLFIFFFGDIKSWLLTTEVPLSVTPSVTIDKISLVLTGDVMFGRNVMNESVKNNDFTYPFVKVSDYLQTSGIVLINLENPVIEDCPKIDSGFTFCSLPQSIDGLLFAGVSVASLANNHTQNFGKGGLTQTEKLLSEKGVLVTGVGDLAVQEVKGLTFGFLGFDFTINEPTVSDYQLIKSSDPVVDVLVVSVHWGVEYEDTLRAFQREWARLMVLGGADLIVGNHPHWVQGAECFDGGESVGYEKAANLETFSCLNGKVPVYYAFGNFVFDQMWSEETKKSVLVKLTFEDENVMGQEVKRTYIQNIGQPEFVD